jgi:hypothetical protein
MVVSVLAAAILAGCGSTPTVTPSPTRAPQPTYTATATVTTTATATATPAATATLVPATTTATATSAPATATATQPPTATVAPTKTPAATATPVAVAKPAPSVDFVVASVRMLTRTENGGLCAGEIFFHARAVDAQGKPLDGVVVHMLWDGAMPNDIVDHPTGLDGAGYVKFFHTAGIFRLVVVKDVSGRVYTSEVADHLVTDYPSDDLKRAAGYCNVDPGKCENCFGHYSYEVVFQRTW